MDSSSLDEWEEDERKLLAALDAFTLHMRQRLLQKLDEGYAGWDEPQFVEAIKKRILHNTIYLYHDRGGEDNEVDIANLLMFLYHQRHNKHKASKGPN